MEYILPFLISLSGTMLFTPFLISYLVKINVVDKPDERKRHNGDIPRLGGIIIFSAFLLNILIFVKELETFESILLGSFVIISCGVLDDIYSLKWKTKILIQSVAALCMLVYFQPYISSLEFFSIAIPGSLSYIILFVFILGVINSINMLDGLDGLAGGFSLLFFFFMIIISVVEHNTTLLVISIILLGSLIGFLKYNAFPAKIFLGDTGSLGLGYFISFAALDMLVNLGGSFDLTIPLIFLSVPVIDTLKVMAVRIYKGRSPFRPDRNHLHHILLGLNIRHKLVVFLIVAVSMIFSAIGIFYIFYSQSIGIILFILCTIALLLGQYYIKTSSIEETRFLVRRFIYVPRFFLMNYKKVFIPLSFVVVFVYVLLSMPVYSIVEHPILICLLFSEIVLSFVAFYNRRKTSIVNDLYIFLNLIIFFSFSYFSDTFSSIIQKGTMLNIVTNYILYALLILISFYIVTREKFFEGKTNFLSGLDLIFSVFVISSFIVSAILNNEIISAISSIMTSAFIIYLWYKLIIIFKKEFVFPIYCFSFVLPTISLIMLLLIS